MMEVSKKREIFNTKLNQLLITLDSEDVSSSTNADESKSKLINRKHSGTVYDNRYQAQKEIINTQKATILEQKQTIEKLILQNTSLENEVAFLKGLIENMKNNSASKTDDNNANLDNEKLVSSPKDPDILCRMKQREEERKKRWQLIKEQKATKERIKKVMDAEKQQEEKLRAIQERRRREQEEIDRKIAAEEELKRIKARKQIAVVEFRKWVVNYYVFIGFKKWMQHVRSVKIKRNIALQRVLRLFFVKHLEIWHRNASANRQKILQQATTLYKERLQRRVFTKWSQFTAHRIQVRIVIETVFNKIYIEKLMITWNYSAKVMAFNRGKKIRNCTVYLHRFLLRFYFDRWKEIPKKIQEKRDQEHRLRSWHTRVKEILPDFDADSE